MNRTLNKTTGIFLTVTMMATLLGTAGSSAAAELGLTPAIAVEPNPVLPAATPLDTNIQPPSQVDGAIQPPAASPAPATTDAPAPPAAASSLEQLVATHADASELTSEMKCLAGAIYFEARSESLAGQLAVGRVIVARTRSGRFPASYCGVVYQRSQFSFVRGQSMPSIDTQSRLWQRAVALAQIADAGSWQSPAEGALFFHAARVTGNDRMTRVAQIDHHIFYR